MEIVVISGIVLFVILQTKMVNTDELFDANSKTASFLKEPDYEFYAKAKYG